MNNKILTLLGFASKAGKLSFGFATSKEMILKNKSRLIVISSDISEKSRKEMRFIAEKNGINTIILDDTEQLKLSNAVGHSCGIVSVNDSSFASAVAEEYGRKC